jgi:hypothetical protein
MRNIQSEQISLNIRQNEQIVGQHNVPSISQSPEQGSQTLL